MNPDSATKNKPDKKFGYRHLFAAAVTATLVFGPQPGRPIHSKDNNLGIANDGSVLLIRAGAPVILDFSDNTLSKRFTIGAFQMVYNAVPITNLPTEQQDELRKLHEQACQQVKLLKGYSQVCVGLKYS